MKIESEKLEIIKAFRDYSYVIPDYQREYIWKEKNVTQLLSDINDEYLDSHDSEYFIGSIVVTKRDSGAFEVMDGQQRLTTLFLSLCALKRLFKDSPQHLNEVNGLLASQKSNEKGEFTQTRHLDLQYKESSEILDYILDGKILDNKLTGSSLNIKEAFETILEYLTVNFQNKEELEKFYGYFMHKVIFVQIETPSVSDALKIFETINERGVGLDPMDLLKNLIFRQLDKNDFQKINLEWKSITKTLDKNKQKALRFLRYFIMANYIVRDTRDNEVIREDEIYNWIVKHADQCGYKSDPFGFVKRIQEGAEAYTSFFQGMTTDGIKSIELENIRNLGGGAFSQHLVMLLAAKDLSNELFLYLVRQMESLIFYYFITKTPAKALETRFSKWADELREVVKNNDPKTALNEFVEHSFMLEKKRLENEYQAMFLNLTINSLQRYKIKYILAKIAQYIESKRIGGEGTGELERYIDSKIEVEHILPNTPTDELIASFDNLENYNKYKVKLGNLTLLEKPHNIVAGRDFFEKKKAVYMQSTFYITKSIAQKDNIGVNTTVTKINDKLIEFAKWESDDIEKRQEMLLALSKEIWSIKTIQP